METTATTRAPHRCICTLAFELITDDAFVFTPHMEQYDHIMFPELYRTPSSHAPRKPRKSPISELISQLERKMEDESFDLSDAEDYYDECFDHVASAKASGSKLLELPSELLTLVIEHAMPPNRPDETAARVHFLKNLRYVHRQFAHLRFIRWQLFKTATFTPDPERLTTLERDVSMMSNFVSQVVFRPHLVHRSDFPDGRKHDPIQRVEEMMSVRTAKAIESGRASTTWIHALENLPRVEDFEIEASYASTPNRIVCGPSNETLLNLALESITAAERRPRGLEIQYKADDEFIYTKNEAWEKLKLSELVRLDLKLEVGMLMRKWDYLKTFNVESALLVSTLLLPSAPALRHLVLSRGSVSCLSAAHAAIVPPPPPLLHLQSLKIDHASVSVDRFSAWISSCTSLKELYVQHIDIGVNVHLEKWFPIFEALRTHRNNLFISFESILACSSERTNYLTLHHQIPDKMRVLDTPIIAMLKDFVSGHGEWDPHLMPESDDDTDDEDVQFQEQYEDFLAQQSLGHSVSVDDYPGLESWLDEQGLL